MPLKKLLSANFLFIFTIFLFSCASSHLLSDANKQQSVRLAPDVTQEMLDASYWISRTKNPYKIKMTKEQIATWNKQIVQTPMPGTSTVYLIQDLRKNDPVISSAEIRENMIRYNPKRAWYTKKGDEIYTLTETDWRTFYKKMNFEPLGDFTYFSGEQKYAGVESKDFPVRKAITVCRSDLRLVPDDTQYTDDDAYWYDDSAQNSGILMNEPVLVLWTSADKKWFYVQTSFCTGWIHREDVAFCSDKEFNRYFDYASQNESSFITITADRAELSREYLIPNDEHMPASIPHLFMGTYLHTLAWEDARFSDVFLQRKPYASYIAEIPYKKADETLGIAYVSVPAGICTEGLLEFTTANTLTLAFKPLGLRYGWGGMADARDCSEYLKDIFRCFGFMLPRNSRTQMAMPGKTIAFGKKSSSARKSAVSSLESGAVMGFPGHVFMYLGKEKGKHYVISALGSYYPDGKTIQERIDVNSVNVNTLEIIRKNGKNWLDNLTQAKSFTDDGTFQQYDIPLNPKWKFANASKINADSAYLYRAKTNRRNIVIALNATRGTNDGTPKETFADGKPLSAVTLRTARLLKNKLLRKGFDVLMLRDSDEIQLDAIARAVIGNNNAAIHIVIQYDMQTENEGSFYHGISPSLRNLKPIKKHWKASERLGQCLIDGLREQNLPIYDDGSLTTDFPLASFSTIPVAAISLGNQHSDTSTESLQLCADGILSGILKFFEK